MIQLQLSENEAAVLAKVLSYYVSELRMEITDTDRQDFRDELKVEEDDLKKILQAIKDRLGST